MSRRAAGIERRRKPVGTLRCIALVQLLAACSTPGIPPGTTAPISVAEGRQRCPFALGDPIERVKSFYGLGYEPERLPQITTGGAVSYYQLNQYGIWILFSAERKLTQLRFEAPFEGRIGGVAVGDLEIDVVNRRGQPARVVPGVIEGWGNPGSPGTPGGPGGPTVPGAPQQPGGPRDPGGMIKTALPVQDTKLPIFMRGLVYNPDTPKAVRYDVATRDRRVRFVFATGCNVD